MKVQITSRIDATNVLSFETEFVVSDDDKAEEKGEQFSRLISAFSAGFGSVSE